MSLPPVLLRWLDTQPLRPTGITFGVPFARASSSPDTYFTLTDQDADPLPTQTWPLAYWPDGSLKWLAIATVAHPENRGPFALSRGQSPPPHKPLSVGQPGIEVKRTVTSGDLLWDIGDRGIYLIQQIS